MMNQKICCATLLKYLLVAPLMFTLVVFGNAQTPKQELPPQATQVDENTIFQVVEKMPQYPGGDSALFKFLGENVRYPVEAQKKGIQGRVICQFVVNLDGSIVDIEVVRSVNSYLDVEALRVIRTMPVWTPGEHKGKKVRVKYTLPINFRLQ